METFHRNDPAYSKLSKNKGRINNIQWDEFFHCLMYHVEFDNYLNPNMIEPYKSLRRYPGYYNCWFKSNDLSKEPVQITDTPVIESPVVETV
jgi:hypothetical protein